MIHESALVVREMMADRNGAKKESGVTDGDHHHICRLKRYLSPQIAEVVLNCPDDESLWESHRQDITVVVLDLRGFTRFADSSEPEEVMSLLRHYHAEMGRLIFKYQGTLERFTGDGLVAFFNDPVPCEEHTERAVRMALEMREHARELRKDWLKKGYDLDVGIGMSAGYATVGNFGFEGRMDYGTVGTVTNLAYRLCDEAKGGQILTNDKTLSRVEELVQAESLEKLQLKGFLRPVSVFNVIVIRSAQP
jgi:adenylate cyclase